MDFSSKDYDRIKVSRQRAGRGGRGGGGRGGASGEQVTIQRTCEVEGCKAAGEYRAPKGRGKEGQYHTFCLDHVREYNKNYNYFMGMTDDDVVAFQRDAIIGHRPTRPIGVRGGHARRANAAFSGFYDDPFGFFGGGGEDGGPAEPEERRIKAPERHAFEIMGLEPGASKDAIKARYKTLVKRHHPDANQGDRSSEERLRSVINAYNVLRRSGYC
ncbi:MAG: J domain-containing protein [Acuticoccus sp.]